MFAYGLPPGGARGGADAAPRTLPRRGCQAGGAPWPPGSARQRSSSTRTRRADTRRRAVVLLAKLFSHSETKVAPRHGLGGALGMGEQAKFGVNGSGQDFPSLYLFPSLIYFRPLYLF